jgi:hypothetical protein
MKVIGRGWQYSVYDLGNGRVLKRGHSPLVAAFVMLRDSFPYVRLPLWEMPRHYREAKKAARCSIPKIMENTLEPWMLANPKMHADGSYEQDMVTPLCICLERATNEEGERLIDAFVEFNKILLKNTIIDKSFDAGNNFGIDAHGRMVLIDLGELVCERAKIDEQLRARIWSAHYVLSGVPRRLHTYFLEKMDEAFLPA